MKTIARDIMATEVMTARTGLSIEEGLKILLNARITGLPVVDESGKMIGIVSEYDLLQQIMQEKDQSLAFKQKAKFTKNPFSIPETMALEEIVKLFLDSKYRRLPVTSQDGKLVGIITRRDLMRVYYYRSKLS
jgi:CBS domain-containing protein